MAVVSLSELLKHRYEYQQYFYHPDHLGSSSFISDASGEACQFLAYLPYGEQWVDQRSSGSYDAPYKFSGKELDAETGYNYFGARYYDSGLSVWLNVDPLNDKSANGNPYSYCEGTPIGSIDINGLFKWDSKLLSDRPRLRSFLENELQSYVRDNPAIVNNLVKYGQFANAEEALKGLKNGEGPDILVIEDPCDAAWKNNNAFAMGCVDKGNPDAIEINSAIIDLFEYALPEDLEAVKFALVSVLTHEYVDQRDASLYYGKGYSGLYDERTKFYMDIDRNEYPKDLGHLFEQKAFGYSIGYGTAEMGPAKNIDDFKQRARDYIDNEVKP